MRRINILSILGYIGLLIIIIVLILLILRFVGIIKSPTNDQFLIALVVGLILHALKIDLGKIKAILHIE